MWLGISTGTTAGSARCTSRNTHCSMFLLLGNPCSSTINTEYFIWNGFCSTFNISFSSLEVPANCRKISYKDVPNLLWWIVCMLQWSKLQLRPITFNDLDISCENTQAYTAMSGQASPFWSLQANEETELSKGCCTALLISSLKLRLIKLHYFL